MMATEVNQTFFAWSQGETSEMGVSQGVPVSQALNHGSISFGRFELESLSWEKWSVFTNDSRSEEFGKFNGLVAQKKAYFEEYYKRIRELKASQQQIQQTELTLEYSGDGSDSSQTGEDIPAEDLESPTGSETIVYDYVKEATHETTSEQGMQCYHDHEDEDFHTEFACGVNSDSGDTENASFGHAGIRAAYENAESPKRIIIEKDPRRRYASMIIPKSIKTIPGSPLDRTSVSEGILKKAAPANATKSTKPESRSNTRGLKTSTLDSHLTRPKRTGLQVSSSVNFLPSKMLSSSVGEPTFARLKKKDGIQGTVQSRASASKKATPSQPRNAKPRAPNPPTPPPPPRRPSRSTNKASANDSSIGGRKPKASTQQWH